jgi:hypothetical protein
MRRWRYWLEFASLIGRSRAAELRPRKIDDEDTVKSIETARYRFSASMGAGIFGAAIKGC